MTLKNFENRLYIKLGKKRADEVLKRIAEAQINTIEEKEGGKKNGNTE